MAPSFASTLPLMSWKAPSSALPATTVAKADIPSVFAEISAIARLRFVAFGCFLKKSRVVITNMGVEGSDTNCINMHLSSCDEVVKVLFCSVSSGFYKTEIRFFRFGVI